MNNDLGETEMFLAELKRQTIPGNVVVMIAPPFTNLNEASKSLSGFPVEVIAQNMHQCNDGAFTGEISAEMLISVGTTTVILGHSERRELFHEGNALLAQKVNTALENEMDIIFCIGEQLEDRKEERHFKVIKEQLLQGLFHISEVSWKNVVVAYEPVWAIGTGQNASPEQAQEMHKFIRKTIAESYNNTIAENVSILYGGSVKPDNAKEIFGQDDVDGGLIGGASLKVESFMNIVNSF